ncbi:microtubule binding protein furry isoform X2 [Lycorma delicatula]|uniref:microtubule binding protein furry isoform X2 n=1 Tax=Lycorma delicatula TaxID=130591 RepID=UPI003F5127E5
MLLEDVDNEDVKGDCKNNEDGNTADIDNMSDSIGDSGATGLGADSDASSNDPGTSDVTSDSLSRPDSRSDTVTTVTLESDRRSVSVATMLPWCAHKERTPQPTSSIPIDTDIRPGEFVMRTLFADFTVQAEKKMEAVLAEPQERPLSKVLQRGEDPQFDQLLSAFGCVAEHCLPSILRALFAWYERQMSDNANTEAKRVDLKGKSSEADKTDKSEVDHYAEERRDLAVEFIFCLLLIEVLKQLTFHPGHEDLVLYIENIAFRHFKYKEGVQSSPNAANIHTVADLYAEVMGALAQSRFMSVRKRFMAELKELRAKEPSPHTSQSIISLLMGMKFFRVKMVPIEEFEASFQFMQECAQYFLEVKDKDVKHALAGLFVEILVPVAATVKNEVNVPCLKNFVESLYSQTLDMCTKSKHRLALFPLVTCLLCVSQKTFFLQNWHYFLAMCLSHLKNRDPKMSRVALESLYRLLWVYMIRIKCESNSATQSRLQSIVNSLFPKGSKAVVPRDTPLNIFVKIIQFIAQERLDFAMREIVFDLLSVGRPIKIILTPERMSIGLRAFLVVADSLQQKEGEPPMPRTSGVLPSGNTLRVKKTFLNKMLTEDTARSIGMSSYFPHVRRVFVDILRALDVHYGRPLMMTSTQNVNKEPDEMITGERKPRIDLFRTCVAAVPRLIPDGMTGAELVDLLARLTVHMDEELRGLAYQSLQTLVIDFPDWRQDVILGFTQFLARDVQDTFPQLLDNGLRMLLQLLTSWKNAVNPGARQSKDDTIRNTGINSRPIRSEQPLHQQQQPRVEPVSSVLHQVEGLALVMLCNCRLCPRRLTVHILRELKVLLKTLGGFEDDQPVIDVVDRSCTEVIEKCLSVLPPAEKAAALSVSNIDLQWIADRSSSVWTGGIQDESSSMKSGSLLNLSGQNDPWAICLFGFLERECVLTHCPTAVTHAWPIVYSRLHSLFTVIDPTPVSDNRASLLRSSAPPRKPVSERDAYMVVWRNYVTFAMRVVPPAPSPIIRCASPDLSLSSSPDSLNAERTDTKSPSVSPSGLYKLVIPLLRCETSDVRDAAVQALGKVNSDALKDLMEELVVYIREAVDRKQENMRRRRRRDALRLQLVRVFELIAGYGTFGISACVLDRDSQSLHSTIVEYVDGARLCLEAEADKEGLRDVKLHFCNFIRKMIKSFALETYPSLLKRDLRRNLFLLFAGWSGVFGRCLSGPLGVSAIVSTSHEPPASLSNDEEELQLCALQAMSAVLCCGPCFDPQCLAEEGYLYPWLDLLMGSQEPKIHRLACETVVLLLECNPDMGPLLDWVVDRCYTAKPNVADGCFLALATIFSAREYPCDHYTAIINVTLMNTGCPRTHIHETALQLLQVLDKRFFGSVGLLPADGDTGQDKERGGTLDLLLSTTYCRSQVHLSRQLAQLHPELTMPMFSEITHRFQTARPEVRQLLLQYILPWLHNMELVDPNVPPGNPLSYFQYYSGDPREGEGRRREGWGSVEATEMVLNNLFYITAKFADEHPKESEEVWATLCSCWPNNLKVIIRYLLIISGMAPQELLPYAKRVVLYLARARPDRLLDEMMGELQTIETLNCLIERTETPPFYRLTSMRKASSHSDPGPGVQDPGGRNDLAVEKGTIHTKRHSGEDPGKTGTSKSDSALRAMAGGYVPPRGADKIRTASGPPMLSDENSTPTNETELAQVEEVYRAGCGGGGVGRFDIPQPHPLPMPEYGGYFAPLTEYLPDSTQPSSGFHRCNVAVMLLTDVVVDVVDLDWPIHVPLMLHILFLGLDHSRTLVHEHCKQLLLNLLLVLADHSDHLSVAQILLNRKTAQLGLGLPTPPLPVLKHTFTDADSQFDSYLHGSASVTGSSTVIAGSTCSTSSQSGQQPLSSPAPDTVSGSTAPGNPTPVIVVPSQEENNTWTGPQPGPNMPIQDVIKSLIDFIASKKNQVLWNYEDITAKVWSCRSVEQLDIFLQHVLRIFRDSLPHALISERWAQTALQLGLSCSSRHYAGRSLQLFRSLRVPITSRMLSDILSRLVETVAEQGEDMQGYVTELLLTLEAAVDSLESDFRPLDFMKEIFKSTPNLNNKDGMPVSGSVGGSGCSVTGGKRSPGGGVQVPGVSPLPSHHMNHHARSTSYSVSYCMRKTTGSPAGCNVTNVNNINDNKEMRSRVLVMSELESRSNCGFNKYSTNLCRSRSAQSLKLLGDSATADDKMTILAQLFWLSVSLLESDYEHEFLLALRLLGRVLHRLPLDRPDARDKVEKLQSQLRWNNFPGVHALLLKGCTSPNTYEPVMTLLSQFTPLLDLNVVDPSQSLAFPMNVIALLPYMLLHYEDANALCIMSAENIAQVSAEKSKKLENLGTVMTLYSRRTFSKESFQWTKCVVKYLYDTYAHLSLNMLAFLVEVLEKGPTMVQQPVLSIIHCMLHYVDLSSGNVATAIYSDLLRVISKYIEGVHWKEALKILKLVVTRSSTLVAPPMPAHPSSWEPCASSPHPSFTDNEVFTKKELPGRTMDFTFDMSQTPLIGRRFGSKTDIKAGGSGNNSVSSSSVTMVTTTTATITTTIGGTGLGLGGVGSSGTASSPRRSVSLSPADSASVSVSGWKRPWMSQGRVRECLVNLLTACGQRVGLPKSPSDGLLNSLTKVIFSQSSDLLERQSSVASSTEEVSGPDLSASAGSQNPDHFGVFKDFDFLEYESESVEGESTDNFNWGVRRRPISEGEAETEGEAGQRTQEESISENTPLLSSRKDLGSVAPEESSDDEVGSESPLDEMNAAPDFGSNTSEGNNFPPSSLNLHERRNSRACSDTSGSSAGDMGDLTPCNASPNLSSLIGDQFQPITRDDTEEVWSMQILSLFSHVPSSPLQLFHLLHRVIKDVLRKSVCFTREACHYLSESMEAASTLVSQLASLTDTLASHGDPPLVWFSVERVAGSRLVEALRFGMLELKEHLDTFLDRKDHAAECMEAVKACLKSNERGDSSSNTNIVRGGRSNLEDAALDLGRACYKLHFQLLLLLESANKMFTVLCNTAHENQLRDLSSEVSAMKVALHRALDEGLESSDQGTPTPTPTPSPSPIPDLSETTLIELLQDNKWSSALQYARHNRRCWPSDLISTGAEEDDIASILSVYCCHLVKEKQDIFVVTEQDLGLLLSNLMEGLFQVLGAVSSLETRLHEQQKTHC